MGLELWCVLESEFFITESSVKKYRERELRESSIPVSQSPSEVYRAADELHSGLDDEFHQSPVLFLDTYNRTLFVEITNEVLDHAINISLNQRGNSVDGAGRWSRTTPSDGQQRPAATGPPAHTKQKMYGPV